MTFARYFSGPGVSLRVISWAGEGVEFAFGQMEVPNNSDRRSTRVRWEIPIRLTSLDPANPFMEKGQTLVVNPQGCGLKLSRPVEVGTAVQLDGLPGVGSVTARVANCISLGAEAKLWLLGLSLDEPGNVWGLQSPPVDWGTPAARVAPPAAAPDPRQRENWPFARFSPKGEFHPGKK